MSLTDSQRNALNELDYTLITGKGLGHLPYPELHNEAFVYWKRFWTEVYSQAGSLDAFNVDDFSRQDLIAVLTHRDKVVGLHLYTVFQLELLFTRDHRYFKFFPPSFFDFMKSRGARSALSIEYLTVDPSFRKSVCGVSLGEVLIGASLRCAQALGADAAIAPARTENKVNTMCYNFGFECFEAGIVKRNFSVDLVAGFLDQVHPNANPDIQSLIDHLWEKRSDLTGLTTRVLRFRKAANAA